MALVFQLPRHSFFTGTVLWSEDQRIAVVSNETLKGPEHAEQPVAVSVVSAPPPATPTCVLSALPKNASPFTENNLGLFVDVKLNGLTPSVDHFIKVSWSPVGCGLLGRCMLGCLMHSGRVLVYKPSCLMDRQWSLVLDLSDLYAKLLKGVKFNILALSGNDAVPGQPVESQPIEKYTEERALLATTVLSWLPVMLEKPDQSKHTILSTAVRAGYIILWSFDIPIDDHQQPTIVDISELSTQGWPCSLKWSISSFGYLLTVGCTSGEVIGLHWNTLTTPISCLLNLWSIIDNVAVDHMILTPPIQDDNDNQLKIWLIFNKGPYLLTIPVSTPFSNSASFPCVLLNISYSLPISGLSLLCNNDVMSCSLDGSVQQCSLPKSAPLPTQSNDSHVTKSDVSALSVPLGLSKPIKSCSGLATSQNSLYIAVSVNFQNRISNKAESSLVLVPVDPLTDISCMDICSWDVYEYLRQNPDVWVDSKGVEPPLSLMIQRQCCLCNNDDELLIRTQLMVHHARNVLSNYLTWKGELDPMSNVSLIHTIQLLTQATTNDTDILLAKKITLLPAITNEACPICTEELQFTSTEKESCSNGHSWNRCVLTLLLITEISQSSQCSLCGSMALISLSDKSWISYLISTMFRCPLCGGYFEPII